MRNSILYFDIDAIFLRKLPKKYERICGRI